MSLLYQNILGVLDRIILSPFPTGLLAVLTANIPVIVFLLASGRFSTDFMINRLLQSQESEVFDFIVVGGGSSGSVVANRLSAKYRTLLIEAGGDPHILSSIPTVALTTLNLPLIDWAYKSVPQEKSCFALKNNVSQIPRGKALGGSSIQNIMMYMRGHSNDYNHWANVTNNAEWSYENLLPFFMKLEDYHGHHPHNGFHGKGGNIHVEQLRFAPGLEYWLKAGEELGYKVHDPNSYQQEGFFPMDVTMKMGSRFSTYDGYIKPLLNRGHLVIYRYSQAVKIHLDRQRRAYGLTYRRHGQLKFARATNEIIISAGAIDSPKLLLLSGIGPKNHLDSIGIKSRVNLPVGENLQDHIFTTLGPITLEKPVSFLLDRDTNLKTVYDYFVNGSGGLVSIAGINGGSLYSTSVVPPDEKNWPDILLFGVGVGVHKSFGIETDQTFGLRPGTVERFYGPSVGKDANFVSVNLARTKSVGRITLKSSNPFDAPLIDPNYYSHSDDVKSMIEGIKFALSIYENTTTFKNLGAKLAPNKFPGCEQFELKSYAYWECYIKHFTLTTYHPCCTNKMGSVGDETAVLDSELRVFHTTGLRVIDASSMPSITNANLNVPCIMLGEKGADLILRYWEKHSAFNDSSLNLTLENDKHSYNSLENS